MTRLILLGLDGGTDSVARLPDARLPNLMAMRQEGASCTLRSTVPPITSAAWASMLSGGNPGRHGMYDFRALDISAYQGSLGSGQSSRIARDPRFVSSARWRGSAIWDIAGAKNAAISGVPMTFPPWQIQGELISGFPLPDYTKNHSAPPGIATDRRPLLEGADRMADMSDEELARHSRTLVDRQAELVRDWLEDETRDLMVAVFQSTDFAQHRLWKYLDRPGHPLREALLDLYRAIDGVIGDARAALGRAGVVAVVSDHGFGPHPRTLLHTNVALSEAGLLTFSRGGGNVPTAAVLSRAPGVRRRLRRVAERMPESTRGWLAARYTGSARINWAGTAAYRFPLYGPTEGVVVNLRGRQSDGTVESGGEYEEVRDRVIATLHALHAPDGQPIVQWARRREDVFRGRYTEAAPDVIALLEPEFKPAPGGGSVLAPVPDAILERYSGVHAMDGLFAVAGAGVRPGVDLGIRNIVDVAPTLLALFGSAIPDPCDGSVMVEALSEDPAFAQPVLVNRPASDDPVLTADEQAALERSLRSLGYLE